MKTPEVGTAVYHRVPFLDLKLEYEHLRETGLEDAILSVLASAHYVQGPSVREFEMAFANYCGASQAVAVDSGTAALHLTLLVLGIGPGDEVVVPVHTFIATAAAVVMVGARPVFVDAEADAWQMDLSQLSERIGPRCRAVIGVHLYGYPLAMDQLLQICVDRGVHLIEDAAQAHGARFCNQRVGSFGKAACFSFYPSKNLGAYGDGGMVVTNDHNLAERVRRLRDHGRITKYEHGEVGFNYRMDELQAVILKTKLLYLDDWNQRRRELAATYRRRLASAPVTIPMPAEEVEPVYHLFTVGVKERDALAKFLAERQIETGVHYPLPLHLQPAFRRLGYHEGDFPVAEKISRETLSLPLFPYMTDEQLAWVCDAVADFIDRNL